MRDGTYIVTVYTFDDEGNVLSEYVYSQDTEASGVNGGESGIHPYAGDGGAYAIPVSNNLLRNSNFASKLFWDMTSTTNPNFSCTLDYIYGTAKFGQQALCMQYDNNTYDEDGVNNYDYTSKERGMQQSISVPAGHLTFSTYLRIVGEISGKDDTGVLIAENPGVYLRVLDASGNKITETEHVAETGGEYLRLIAPFDLSKAQNITVQILMDGKGKVYVNGAQLETNEFASPYNMVENGHFGEEKVVSVWERTDGAAFSSTNCLNTTRSLQVVGSLAEKRGASQEICVHREIGTRETFTLSGWAKGCGTADNGSNNFNIKAVIDYEGGYESDTFFANFSTAVEDWHFASVEVAKRNYARVKNITVSCNYDFAYGTVYFDDIQLVQNSIEKDLDKSDFVGADYDTDTETAETSEAIEAIDEAEEAPLFEEYVDAYGNTVTETTFSDGELGTIYRSFGYDASSGNNLVKEIDARGNVTEYTVDAQTSRNLEAKDRCGNKTAYAYDEVGRTTMVTSKDAADSEVAAVRYLYDDFGNLG